MAQARRRPSGRRTRKPGWLLLLIGIGIGVASVVLWQMYARHSDGRSGLSNLLHSFNQPADKPAAKKEPEPAKPVKPKFDFYTILPETETVLPERRSARNKPPAKTKPDDGASYILQAGSFASYEEADQLKAKLALSGMVAQIQKVIIEGKGEYHRVRLGPYEKAEQLDAPAQQLQKMGIKVIRLKIKKGGAGPSPL
jgi:cell division protein FtsN